MIGQIYPQDQRTGIAQASASAEAGFYATEASIVRYCSPTGSDEAGDGSVGNPYREPLRAYQDLPRIIKHPCAIRLGAGSYAWFPDLVGSFEDDGCLVFEGVFSDVMTGIELLAVASDSIAAYGDVAVYFSVAAPLWVADELQGKVVEITDGVAAGQRYVIWSNTTTEITANCPYYTFVPAMGDHFRIIEQACVIDNSGVISFSGTQVSDVARIALVNVDLRVTGDGSVFIESKQPFCAPGSILRSTAYEKISLYDASISLLSSSVSWPLVDTFYSSVNDLGTFVGYHDFDTQVDPASGVHIGVISGNWPNFHGGAYAIVTHGQINCDYIYGSLVGRVQADSTLGSGNGNVGWFGLWVHGKYGNPLHGKYSVVLDNALRAEVAYIYIKSSASVGISVSNCASCYLHDIDGVAAQIVGQTLAVDRESGVILGTDFTLSGVAGQLLIVPSNQTVNFPTGSLTYSVPGQGISVGSNASSTANMLFIEGSITLTDDASYNLPAKTGSGFIQESTDAHRSRFHFTADGVVTLEDNTVNVVNTDSDTKLCIFDAGSNARIRNRLGGTKTFKLTVWM